jgi:tetratricopeptide (TPR) repeat protein
MMGKPLFLLALGVAFALPVSAQERPGEAERALEQAFVRLVEGEFSASRDEARRALAGFERRGILGAQVVTLEMLGAAEIAELRKKEAFVAFAEAFARAVRAQDDFAIAATGSSAGRLAAEVGEPEDAESFFGQGLEALARIRHGDRWVGWFEWHHAVLGLPFDGDATFNSRRRLDDRALDTAEGALRRQRGQVRTWTSDALTDARADLERAQVLLPADHEEHHLAEADLGALELFARNSEAAYARLVKAYEGLRGRAGSMATAKGLRLTLVLLAEIDDQRGRFAEALAWLDQARGLVERRNDPAAETSVLIKRSWILTHAGRAAEAEAALLAAQAAAQKSGDKAALADVQRTFAVRELAAGHFEKAGAILAALASKTPGQPTCNDHVSALQLALAYELGGRPDEGGEVFRQLSTLPLDPKCGEVEYFQRLVGFVLAQNDEKEKLRSIARFVAEPTPPLIGVENLAAIEILWSLLGGGEPTAVLKNKLEPLLQQAQQRGDRVTESILRQIRGEIHLGLGNLAAARVDAAWLTASAPAANPTDSSLSAAWLTSRIARQDGRSAEAIRHLDEALAITEKTLGETQLDEFLLAGAGGHAFQYETLVDWLLEAGRFDDAFGVAERSRSQALVRLLSGPVVSNAASGDFQIRREVQRLRGERRVLADRHARGELDAEQFARLSVPLESRFEEASLRLKLTRQGEAPPAAPAPLSIPEAQNLLPPETSLVTFFVLTRETAVWVIDRERVTTLRLPLGRDELASLVSGFRERIATRRPLPGRGAEALRTREADSPAGDALSARLWAPVAPLVRHSRVVLAPHDTLHALPFAALRNPNGRFLITDFTLSYVPGAATLRYLRRPRAAIAGSPLVIGDPALPPSWKLEPLAGARAEATRLASRLGTTPFLAQRATETTFREHAAKAGLLHVAAHFVRRAGQPRFSYLALAPDEKHDGRLEGHELFDEITLPAARLVVLSACETALGRRTDGDEIEGAVRGLLDAGSAAVLATHWAIDDEVSTDLMDRFYERLLAGEAAAEALRRAQLATLERHPAPHFWAAFGLTGDPALVWPGG